MSSSTLAAIRPNLSWSKFGKTHAESVPHGQVEMATWREIGCNICNLEVPPLNCVGCLQHFVAILKANIRE